MIPAEDAIVLPTPSITPVVARILLIALACVLALGVVVVGLGYAYLAFALTAVG